MFPTSKEREPGVELIYVDYKDLLYKTDQVLEKITSYVGQDLDKKALAAFVVTTLY
ncbi:hypothetical protein [Bizionia arctica]|uniref:Sulfotransferase domain-containing protein n=1 Tax=Bizionia arctica TaxID=1495645 RepID=A0A917G9V0_9FLAO|nr:hypothetical protein [Bizionia arctica]GGG32736.1 hypothetical protein GCM10010976_00650 [Bizionia arctica]